MIEANRIICGDCLTFMRSLPDKSIDLVITSPPYENVRSYGIDFDLKGQKWVDWCAERFKECVRVCKGVTAFVVEGKTKSGRWSATPALLMADLHRSGVRLRKPPIYKRFGIPGTGGPYWLRNDYEFCICASHECKLPFSDNTCCGGPPKCLAGGPLTYRDKNGKRNSSGRRIITWRDIKGTTSKRDRHGNRVIDQRNRPIKGNVNPGNVIDCGSAANLGNKFGHENEAPFPSKVPETFIRSFCPPGGIVLDPFCGSGTTLAVAKRWGRNFIGIDVRQSQVELSQRHVESVKHGEALAA